MKFNQQLHRIEVSAFEMDNSIVFNYFNNLKAEERDEKLIRAIYIGVLAMMEDRISAFLSKTSNELGTELESLKLIFELNQNFESLPIMDQLILNSFNSMFRGGDYVINDSLNKLN